MAPPPKGSKTPALARVRGRSRSVSMSRIQRILLAILVRGLRNSTGNSCSVIAIISGLVATLVPMNERCQHLPTEILDAYTNLKLNDQILQQLSRHDTSPFEAFAAILTWAPFAPFVQHLEVIAHVSEPDGSTSLLRYPCVIVMASSSSRRHNPACVVSTAFDSHRLILHGTDDMEPRDIKFSIPETCHYFLAYFEPDAAGTEFDHFPETYMSWHGRSFKFAALIVKHPLTWHFVTLVRRGAWVFLLDADNEPAPVLRKIGPAVGGEPTSELLFWLRYVAFAIIVDIGPPLPFVGNNSVPMTIWNKLHDALKQPFLSSSTKHSKSTADAPAKKRQQAPPDVDDAPEPSHRSKGKATRTETADGAGQANPEARRHAPNESSSNTTSAKGRANGPSQQRDVASPARKKQPVSSAAAQDSSTDSQDDVAQAEPAAPTTSAPQKKKGGHPRK